MEAIIAGLKAASTEISVYLRDSGASSTEVLETINDFGDT
jgi:sedoheptulose-bisphosphatase